MTRSHLALCTFVAAIGCAVAYADDPKPGASQESWVGKKVMVRRPGVAFSGIGDQGQFVNFGNLKPSVVEVKKEAGGLVFVRDVGKEGWADRAAFIPLDDAMTYFTERIRADSKDAEAWKNRGIARATWTTPSRISTRRSDWTPVSPARLASAASPTPISPMRRGLACQSLAIGNLC
jgi:hypothetical protein